ncbi:MAG: MarR family transcriptional regulator [Actinobacteria bacterium]|nr:MarR family transcriptional regulator [Actinomycetota bacterium]
MVRGHPIRYRTNRASPIPSSGGAVHIGTNHEGRQQRTDIELATECVVELIRTESIVAGELDVLFRRHGLTGPGFNVLLIIDGAGEPLPPHVIGERRLVTRGTVTGLLDTLERRGLVRRLPHPDDRRMLLVDVTDQARTLVRKVTKELLPRQEELASGLSAREKATLIRLLRKLQVSTRTPAS